MALAQNPRLPKIHYLLGYALNGEGRRDEAIVEFKAELQINPHHLLALNDLAWSLATDPDPAKRDGAQAVVMAERACIKSDWKVSQFLGTLAAAYAEMGRYQDAIGAAERAKTLASENGEAELAQRNEELLEYYRKGQAYHEQGRLAGASR